MDKKIHTLTMIKTSLRLGLAVILLLQIPSAFAYLSPDQVFGGAGLTLSQPPPTAREAADVVAQQQQGAAEQRAAVQSSLPSTEDEAQDDFVPVTEGLGLFTNEGAYERRQERMDASDNGTTIIIGDSVLHSGAPRVSATGPATTIAGLTILAAIAGTFGYLRYRSRRLSSILFS